MGKDIKDPELQEMDSILEVVPTLRGRFLEMVVLIGICMGCIKLMNKVPPYGMYLDYLLGIKFSWLHFKLSYEVLVYPLKGLALTSLILAAYIYLQQKMTKYKLTDLYLLKSEGVLLRESNSTDLVSMKDYRTSQNLLERILGITRLTIMANDVSDPEMIIKGVDNTDATKMINFLRKYAFRNYTEYRIAREKEIQRTRRKKDLDVIDDGGDDDGDGN